MAMTTPLAPLSGDAFGLPEARHLLRRVGMGGPTARAAQLAAAGPAAAVAQLLDGPPGDPEAMPDPGIDPDLIQPPDPDQRRALRQARARGDREMLARFRMQRQMAQRQDRQALRELQAWWVRQILETPHPARESLTLLWHDHFATGYEGVKDAYLMAQQNAMFRARAMRFDALLAGIVRDPAMIKYLNNDQNRRQQPNENLARELMELFALGEGRYAERDIKEGARALTGYGVEDNDFTFRKRAHDTGTKRIMGARGDFDGDAFAALLLRRRDCARFIATKLYAHFVADVPEDPDAVDPPRRSVIDALAEQIHDDEYDLRPALGRLLASQHFYDPANVGSKVKSPAELVAQTARCFGTPTRSPGRLVRFMEQMGQHLLMPPSVAGWDHGRAWINTATLFARQNTCVYLFTGRDQPDAGALRSGRGFEPMKLLPDPGDRTPQAAVDALVDLGIGEHVPAARRQPLVRFAQDKAGGGSVDAETVMSLLILITALPEYQLG